jgi:hypothetical protein
MNFKAPEYAVQCPFMISFYEYIPETQLPGELLYDKPLFYFPKKDGKQSLSLDSLNIFVPREGIFICFELIMDDRFQWSLKNGDSTVVNQGVLLDGVYSNDYRLAFFNYAKNTWMGPRSYSEGEPPKLRGTIKLSLAFRYCDE